MSSKDYDYYKVKVPRKDKSGMDITTDKILKGGRRRDNGTFSGLAYDFEKFDDTTNYQPSSTPLTEDNDEDGILGLLGISLLGAAIFSGVKKAVNNYKTETDEKNVQRTSTETNCTEQDPMQKIIDDEQVEKEKIKSQVRLEEYKQKQKIKKKIRLEKYQRKQEIKLEKYKIKQQTKILEMKEKSAKAKGKKDADFHKMNERQNFASDETKTNKMLLTPAMFFVAFKTALDNFLSNTTDFRYQEELFKLFIAANEISKRLHNGQVVSRKERKNWNKIFKQISSSKIVDYINYIIINNEQQLDSKIMDYVLINFQGGIYDGNDLIPIKPMTVKNKLYLK